MSRIFESLNQAQRERALLEQGRFTMESRNVLTREDNRASHFSLREFVAILFRQRRVVVLSFSTVLLATFAVAILVNPEYEAETKILIEQTRQDPVVTSDPIALPAPSNSGVVTEEDINSEVALMQGSDLLEKVVVACGLDTMNARVWYRRLTHGAPDKNISIAEAVAKLRDSLHVEPPKKSNLISVSYRSRDPQLAARVLNTLSGFYLEKHAAVHRPSGTYEFFQKETERFRTEMDKANQKLIEFNRQQNVVSPEVEKANVLQQVAQFESSQQQANSSIAEIQNRIRELTNQIGATPQRKTTLIKTSSIRLDQLQAHLFELDQRRLELLNKFEPTYRPVQELDKEISATRVAIAEAEKAPIKEETTDEDPTYAWLLSDLAKAKADLATLQARAAATQHIVDRYQEQAHQLDQKSLTEQDLLRNSKVAEDGYVAYQRKEEEARMSEALDQNQIMNVAIAEAAMVPYLPISGRLTPILTGLLLALLLSVLGGIGADRWDHSFHTPGEMEFDLQIPVLAAMPKAED